MIRKHIFRLLIIISALAGCNNINYEVNTPAKQYDNTDELLSIANQALSFIKEGKSDSLVQLFEPGILSDMDLDSFREFLATGQDVLLHSKFPAESRVTVSRTFNHNGPKTFHFNLHDYPFKYQKEGTKKVIYFRIAVTDNRKIFGMNISDKNPLKQNVIEPEHTQRHLDRLDLQAGHITWFRVWYESGFKNEVRYAGKNYYAASGDRKALDRLGNKKLLQELFVMVNGAQPDSVDFRYMDEEIFGNPEIISLRFMFDNSSNRGLGEFKLTCHFEDEPGEEEIMSEYIVLKHTEKTRYLFLKEKHRNMVEKLKEIAGYNYGTYYEVVGEETGGKKENPDLSDIKAPKKNIMPAILTGTLFWGSVMLTALFFILNLVFSFAGNKRLARVCLYIMLCGIFLFLISVVLLFALPYLNRLL